MDEAEFRAIAKAGRDIEAESWDEAHHFVEHTLIGACYLLHERAVDVGRAIRGALPGWLRRHFQ
jgi:hypothetical protein